MLPEVRGGQRVRAGRMMTGDRRGGRERLTGCCYLVVAGVLAVAAQRR